MSQRLRTTLTVGVVVLGLVFAAVWYAVPERVLRQVRVEAGLPRCQGVAVREYVDVDHDDVGPGFTRPAIPLRRGMRCTLVYRVTNGSSRRVSLSRFVYPIGGPGGGAGFRVTAIDGDPLVEDAARGDVDAVWTAGRELDAEGSLDLAVEVRFRARGCTASGHVWASPEIEVRYVGRRRTFTGPSSPVFRGTRASSCDSRTGQRPARLLR